MEKYELGFRKNLFSISYAGGEIWCEHLDALCEKRDLFFEKLKSDIVH